MMDPSTIDLVLQSTGAKSIAASEKIQTLWNGYGEIVKIKLTGGVIESVIVKMVRPPTNLAAHPRGWTTNRSDRRKRDSYKVEASWYRNYSSLQNQWCRTPDVYAIQSDGDDHVFVIEDLDACGFGRRIHSPTIENIRRGLRWLAHFHALHLDRNPVGLWNRGTYWHLDTRPDELAAMPTDDRLRVHAKEIDRRLVDCEFQTIVHGDAKLANFCFSEDATRIAAVDFQYVGGGCGMSDVAYFIGSCMIDDAVEGHLDDLLTLYFDELAVAVERNSQLDLDIKRLRDCWTHLFPVAWADFNRFLIGWCPDHPKLTPFSETMTTVALERILPKS